MRLLRSSRLSARVSMLAALLMVLALLPAGAQAQSSGGPLPIPEPEVNSGLPPGLIQYSDIAAELNRIARSSNRVRAEVLGQSAGGRDLYLVTVADRNADRETTKALRRLMLRDPARAQQLVAESESFRVPVFLNCSIHGNEYEGVDACLEIIERLAFGNDPETQAILDNVILVVNVVQNPDGRVLNTRANANGFDLNRDFITNSQPETRYVRDLLASWNPMVFLDYHGYVNPMLIEPTTPPHNPNYEYDLYIKHALGQALAMEDGVIDSYARLKADPDFAADYAQYIGPALASEENVIIPFRDWDVGDWDDWPPIFAPMYAMYHGAFGSTLEAPLNPRTGPLEQRAARARVNTEALIAAGWSTLLYVVDNKVDMVTDQLEVFRRGGDAVTPVPIEPGFVPGYGPKDEYPANYPEAYIIPRGDGQASELAAARLVDFLIDHGVEVGVARAGGIGFDDQRWPEGSYLVSMKQPKRGLANTILELGYDISTKSPQMYDISGWSHAELWGATVVTIPKDSVVRGKTNQARGAAIEGNLPAGDDAAYGYSLNSQQAIQATNALLDAGVTLRRGEDGTIVVPGDAKALLGPWAGAGIVFTALSQLPELETLEKVRIAVALGAEERFVLGELGFEIATVTTGTLNSGAFDINAYDALMISAGFNYNSLNAGARETLTDWLEDGGGVVTVGNTGATFNAAAGLLEVTSNLGPACATANGVAAVDNAVGSTITAGFPAGEDTSFVFAPLWFTNLGEGVVVDQSYDTENVLLAGHWLGDFEGWEGAPDPGPRCGSARANSTQADAAGHASVVSGTDETGARVVVFGTQPLFRDHPKKLYQQVAQALYWVTAD